MASSSYPGSLDNYSSLPSSGTPISVASHYFGPAITKIETELGTDPAGTFTDVKSRLDDTDKKVITEIDQFELTSTYSLTTINTVLDLTANLARVSTGSGFSKKGTGMTESSGIFSFPSTGYYFIEYKIAYNAPTIVSTYSGGFIAVTEDNFSTIHQRGGYTNIYATNAYGSINFQIIFKVDSTSTHKCKFQLYSQGTAAIAANNTYMNFIKLGEL